MKLDVNVETAAFAVPYKQLEGLPLSPATEEMTANEPCL